MANAQNQLTTFAHWPMKSCSGGSDMSGNGNDVILEGLKEKRWPNDTVNAECILFLYFCGSRSSYAHSEERNLGNVFSVLIKVYAECTYCPIIELKSVGYWGTKRLMLWIIDEDTVEIKTTSGLFTSKSMFINFNTLRKTLWIAFEYNNSTGNVEVFIDDLKTFTSKSGAAVQLWNPFHIWVGKRSLNDAYSDYYFKGFMQHIHVYDTVLSRQQFENAIENIQGNVRIVIYMYIHVYSYR